VQHSSTSSGPRHVGTLDAQEQVVQGEFFRQELVQATFLGPSCSAERLGKVDGRARDSEENQALGGVLISGGESSTRSAYLYHISRAVRRAREQVW